MRYRLFRSNSEGNKNSKLLNPAIQRIFEEARSIFKLMFVHPKNNSQFCMPTSSYQ